MPTTNNFFGNALDSITDGTAATRDFFFGAKEPDSEDYESNFVMQRNGVYQDTNTGNIVDTRNVLQKVSDGTGDATRDIWKAATTGEGRRNSFLEENFGIDTYAERQARERAAAAQAAEDAANLVDEDSLGLDPGESIPSTIGGPQGQGFLAGITNGVGNVVGGTFDFVSGAVSGVGDATSSVINSIRTGEGIGPNYIQEEFGINPYEKSNVTDDPAAAAADQAAADMVDEESLGLGPGETIPSTIGGSATNPDVVFGATQPAAAPGFEEQFRQVDEDDWRIRLHLAGGGPRILYRHEEPGILQPLVKTNGIIFPYTPTINIQYQADYESYDLTHSNYRGYFYKGSSVQNLVVTATFTAQDTDEANYMLASLHFLRSLTKMFYGQDQQRGTPPPLVFLTGYGEYQFKDHPCVVTTMAYNLPNDVDYIAAGVPNPVAPTNFRQEAGQSQEYRSPLKRLLGGGGSIGRLLGAGLQPGAERAPTVGTPNRPTQTPQDLDQLKQIYKGKTYVPTKMDINFTMLPINTRHQVSKEFSLREYANGKLLQRGMW